MTDEISTPVDLSIKRKSDGTDDHRKSSTKKKSRSNHQLNNDNEIPLDLSVKTNHSLSPSRSTNYSTATMPFYDPTNLFFNSSALLYDLLLTNLNSYCHQQQRQMRPKSDGFPSTTSAKSSKGSIPLNSVRSTKDVSLATNKQESYACSCGERYSNAAQLVSHLKITNHSAQSSSTHDEVAKLVRGQDIWLSRDTNPANQILKCLRCSLSFETLPDLTAHMMKTNHFTQLASNSSTYPHSNPRIPSSTSPLKSSSVQAKSTCLVCSQQFSRELDLVDHLQRLHQIRFNCTTCGMYFENENLYKDHLLKEMHHRNGKSNRNRDYFLSQYKHFSKQCNAITESKSEENDEVHLSVDKEIEQLTMDLIDRISNEEREKATSSSNASALSLLQNFVRKQTPTNFSPMNTTDAINDENSNQSLSNASETASISSSSSSIKVNDSPLASLEKMLAYPTKVEATTHELIEHGTKRKKFDKYRLFAEKMLRSTLS